MKLDCKSPRTAPCSTAASMNIDDADGFGKACAAYGRAPDYAIGDQPRRNFGTTGQSFLLISPAFGRS